MLVAERAGRVVGVVAVEPCRIEGLYVLPAEWGRGAATLLHAAALRSLVDAGCTTAALWVLEGNARARRFYEKHGWRPDGTTCVVPFPPHPLDVGYSLEIGAGRPSAPSAASCSATR